jgi:hypothetical protein
MFGFVSKQTKDMLWVLSCKTGQANQVLLADTQYEILEASESAQTTLGKE